MRELTYAQAINEALRLLLETDDRVMLIGQGVTSPWYVGTTTAGLIERFGNRRVIDPPVSENGITGVAIGAALAGSRSILVFPRMDFMYLAMDQIANHAANWHAMFGGEYCVPLTIWGIINRGGEQAAQHSQALQAIFAHIPGLKVVMPSNGYDAKGLLISSVRDGNPVVFIDDRWLYNLRCVVPEGLYQVPIGKGAVLREGKDVSVITSSYTVHEVLKAADECRGKGISVEVVDLRTIKPLDSELILGSVRKTGRVVIVDGGWKAFGVSGEIAARIAETPLIRELKAPICRLSLPDAPAPASTALEDVYYPRKEQIAATIQRLLEA
ncbi:MAG: transketolase C-terminal domain-containing protein [Candidatus Methanomethylicaceae archaeon]|jgi:pyruvate dehydrogenase E1 component beta subunit